MATYEDGGRKLTIETYGRISMVRVSPVGSMDSREIYIPLSTLKEMVDAQ